MNAQYAAIAYSKSMWSANATYAEYANSDFKNCSGLNLHLKFG